MNGETSGEKWRRIREDRKDAKKRTVLKRVLTISGPEYDRQMSDLRRYARVSGFEMKTAERRVRFANEGIAVTAIVIRRRRS